LLRGFGSDWQSALRAQAASIRAFRSFHLSALRKLRIARYRTHEYESLGRMDSSRSRLVEKHPVMMTKTMFRRLARAISR
jgi:hypothetical protein